jgi:membrane-associated protein
MMHLVDIVLHLDAHLAELTAEYGTLTYAILFIIVFCETGLVVTPFLPGDSLLFAAGTVSALGSLHVMGVWGTLLAAAVIGDNTNYWIGRTLGTRLAKNTRIVKPSHLERTHRFFEKYGRTAIILARYVPLMRTFVPFVAGLGRMTYRVYLPYDILGGLTWVSIFVFGGYFFGNMPWVKGRFHIVILAIIVISLVPMAVEFIKHWRRAGSGKTSD